MAYCRHCGKSIDPNALSCPYCGQPQYNTNQSSHNQYGNNQYGNNHYGNNQYSNIDPNDKYSFLWGALSYFIPIVGIIYFIVKRKTSPKKAKSALIGVIVSIVLSIIYYIFAAYVGFLDLSPYTDAYDMLASATDPRQI